MVSGRGGPGSVPASVADVYGSRRPLPLQQWDFIWFVGTNGHHWIEARAAGSDSEDLFLSDLVPVGSTGYRPTRPLRDHSGLFREFAATPRDKDSIKAFADRNGLLGGPG